MIADGEPAVADVRVRTFAAERPWWRRCGLLGLELRAIAARMRGNAQTRNSPRPGPMAARRLSHGGLGCELARDTEQISALQHRLVAASHKELRHADQRRARATVCPVYAGVHSVSC
jgi:hypothetical protein